MDRKVVEVSSLSLYLSIYLAIYPSIHLSIYPSIHPSIYLPTYLSISIYLSIFLSIYLLSICRFWKCYKTLTFCSLLTRSTIPCACHAERHLNVQKWREHVFFLTFDFEMCFAPQRRALFRHLNFQKCSEREVLLAFSLASVLRATTACTFSTSQLLKVVRS